MTTAEHFGGICILLGFAAFFVVTVTKCGKPGYQTHPSAITAPADTCQPKPYCVDPVPRKGPK